MYTSLNYAPVLYTINWGITPPDLYSLVERIKMRLGSTEFQVLKRIAENCSSKELLSVIKDSGLLTHQEDQDIFLYNAEKSVSVRNTFYSILLNS